MYYIVFLLGIILTIFKDKKRISFIVFALVLAVMAFLRYGVGADYFNYETLYSSLDVSLLFGFEYGASGQEPLFRLIGLLLKKIGFSYQQYLMVIATINLYYVYKLCKKYSINPTFSLLLYFCFYYFTWTFNAIRQGITLTVGIYYLLEFIENKKIIKFIFVVFVLSLIHTSAIILLPLYFMSKLNLGKRKLLYLSFISLFMATLPILNLLAYFTWLPFINRIMPYITSDVSLINIFDLKNFVRFVFLFIALLYYDVYSKQNDMSKQIINIHIISLIVYFVLKSSETTAARLAIYGMFLNIIILPNIYYLYKQKINKLIYLALLFVLCNMYLYKELDTMGNHVEIINNNSIITPYTNIFNKDKYFYYHDYLDLLK